MTVSRSDSVVWLNGKIISEKAATVPILTHSLQYGSGMFEGIRAYATENGPAVFRLDDHIKRFFNTAKMKSMDLGYTRKQISDAVIEVVKRNKLGSCYIRPFAFYDDAHIGMATEGKKVSVFIAAVPFGAYFGSKKSNGIKCKVSSWRRINSNILPVQAKSSGNYVNSIMADTEAIEEGFDSAVLLSESGYVSEGPAENIFLVKDGVLVTPSVESDILLGITRDSIIHFASYNGISTEERLVRRDELYSADEMFFAGTAAEITPITHIDGKKVGNGRIGSMTSKLSDIYSRIVSGKEREFSGWLTYVK